MGEVVVVVEVEEEERFIKYDDLKTEMLWNTAVAVGAGAGVVVRELELLLVGNMMIALDMMVMKLVFMRVELLKVVDKHDLIKEKVEMVMISL